MTTASPTAAGVAQPPVFRTLRRTWLAGTIALSLAAFAAAIALAPAAGDDPGAALGTLLFLGSSVHVASTAWFFTLPEVRGHARTHPGRYIVAPAALVAGTAAAAVAVPYSRFQWALLAFFAWQFFHFQKQNLGMAALAGICQGGGSLSRPERLGIMIAGVGGIAGLLTHPDLLQLGVDARLRPLFPAALAVFAAGAAVGLYGLARRTARPRPFVAVYLISLLFFAPVFAFGTPYPAVAGLTIAHGFQYLLLVGLLSGAPRPGHRPGAGTLALTAIAVLGGIGLAYASHLHGSPDGAARALYGAYLGAVMAHFVVDAGLWRLRDAFPRRLLDAGVPYLLKP
ncbi:hypothetical protein [Actinomadura parmotrematis]|uniref:Beta-carotene 15,15'-dioxygenase n=1 Tax=Actinomadura parmotrematis TaxID=2864039 RepID=A0ABS7FX06_9ACTN|nr:hypothetical protein [Actinomadura parmotrematis]MBW8484963.1 hypothetical protein [Actinomadura parmotrematis]